jgi:hypothetical protein
MSIYCRYKSIMSRLYKVINTVDDKSYQQRDPLKRGKIYYFFVFLNVQNIK